MKLLDTKYKRKSMAITVTINVLLILLLLLAGFTYLDPPPENGIAVNFGTMDTGNGDIQPREKVQTSPKQTQSTPQNQTKTDPDSYRENEKVVTQDNEDAPVVKKEKKKETTIETKKEKKPLKEEKQPDPKPDKSTTDALNSLLNGPKNDGTAKGGEGNDATGGDKGDPNGDPNAKSYYGTGKGLDGDGNYLLGGRKALNKQKYVQECNEAGTVVVSIEVDRNGKVISATPILRGSTNISKCLLEPARRAALATKFNKDSNAPVKQIGKIIYKFSLSN